MDRLLGRYALHLFSSLKAMNINYYGQRTKKSISGSPVIRLSQILYTISNAITTIIFH